MFKDVSPQMLLEMLKLKVRRKTISYSSYKKKQMKDQKK